MEKYFVFWDVGQNYDQSRDAGVEACATEREAIATAQGIDRRHFDATILVVRGTEIDWR